jgi:hypothetical protein
MPLDLVNHIVDAVFLGLRRTVEAWVTSLWYGSGSTGSHDILPIIPWNWPGDDNGSSSIYWLPSSAEICYNGCHAADT